MKNNDPTSAKNTKSSNIPASMRPRPAAGLFSAKSTKTGLGQLRHTEHLLETSGVDPEAGKISV
jgi:hypothetical protein